MPNLLAAAASRARLTLTDLAGPRPAYWIVPVLAGVLALLAGYVVSAMGTLAMAAVIAAMVGGWLAYLTFFGPRAAIDWFFLAIVAAGMVLPMSIKLFGLDLFPYVQLVFFVISLSGVRSLLDWARHDPWLRASLVAFAVFMVLGVANSILGRSVFLAATYQFISNLKPMLLVALGFGMAWAALTERIFWGIVRWALLPNFLFVFAEWASPSLYFKLFSATSRSLDPSGFFPSRAVGIFEHPAVLANLTSLMWIVTVARIIEVKEERRRYILVAAGYWLLLVCSAQRGELAAAQIATTVAVLSSRSVVRWVRAWVLGGVVVSVCLFLLVFSSDIVRESLTWGIGAMGGPQHPRAQLFDGALQVSSWNPPFGAGLGTYGGAGAEKFDVTLYDQLGFERYWWYLRENFLMDTYWPNSLAETGYLGALLLLASYVCLGVCGMRRANRSPVPMARAHWLAAGSGVWFMLANSFSSPAFQDPRLFLLAAVNFGIAARLEQRR